MLKQNTYRKGILWMLLFNAVAKAMSFVLGIILAKNFIAEETDVYLYIWGIINVVIMIVSSVNLMVVGPAYILLSETGEDGKAAKLCSGFMNVYMAPVIIFSVLTLLFPFFTYGVLSGFTHAQLIPFDSMLRLSGIWMLLVVVNLFLGNLFMSRKFFLIYILGQVVAASITLLFILVFKKSMGIDSFFTGQMIGNIACLLFYLYFIYTRLRIRLKLFYFRIPYKTLRETGATLIVSVPTMVFNFLLVFYLSHYAAGLLSAYNYGSTLSNLPDVIFLSQFVSVFGVRFAEIVARGQHEMLFNTFRHYGNHLFFFMCGIAIVLSLASPAIIEAVYGKESLGESVYNSAVLTVSLMAAILPFKALDVMNNRLFASIQALSSLVKYTLPVKLFNIGLLVLMEWVYGFKGLLTTQIIMGLVVVSVQIYLLGKYFPAKKIAVYFYHVLLLLLISLGVFFGLKYLSGSLLETLNPILRIILISIIVSAIGLVVEKIFKFTSFHKMIFERINLLFKRKAIS